MILINENPTLQNSLRSQQKSLQKKPKKNMNAQFNKKKKQKTKTHPCINLQGKKKRKPGGRADRESNKNIIRRRNHGMRSNSKPELPIDIYYF